MRIFCENSQKSIIIPSPNIRTNSSTQTNYRLWKKSQSESSPKQMKWNPRRPENLSQGAYQQTTVVSPLNSSLSYILILLMLHYLVHHKHWRGRRDKTGVLTAQDVVTGGRWARTRVEDHTGLNERRGRQSLCSIPERDYFKEKADEGERQKLCLIPEWGGFNKDADKDSEWAACPIPECYGFSEENKCRGWDAFNEDEYEENTFDVYERDGTHLTFKEPPPPSGWGNPGKPDL